MKTLKSLLLGAGAMMAMLTACSGNATLTESGLDPAKFDTTINDKPVKLFVLKNAKAEVCVTNFGARVVSIAVPDKNGKLSKNDVDNLMLVAEKLGIRR